ncbi:Hypothetical protein CpCap5W_1861 [Corynebacterium pseudotuberculosis]|nr:Hypothetical protein Cp3995_0856 [Corynebacterium pseudotuberculosis 3/99-5]AFH51779.1 Hypothetical protein Cp267_0877 [Corynebacterium pseudotuberculosis 267]AIG07228.1 hypothetical protein CPTA_01399 [Corynebacterium pseudotuberculosis]AIG08189.1 hypothetical protein CPTB_00133 [Corynebacterium pseudotuberculosis]AIG11677.1 hypothetical protein CPTC_01389 [Corynebacterium pseudotuberculosis]
MVVCWGYFALENFYRGIAPFCTVIKQYFVLRADFCQLA